MKGISSFISLALAAVVAALPSPVPQQGGNNGGSGQFAPASWTRNNGLPRHSFYAPNNIPSGAKFPVLIWGNGACSADTNQHLPFLIEVASHGTLVIANGAPGQGGSTDASWERQALDWIVQNGGKGALSYVDTSKIAVAGMSCGGVEAYDFVSDARVTTVGIFNSGHLDVNRANRELPSVTKPIFFFLGGQSDIAYGNGERDYRTLPATTPKWKGNLNVGHGGTYTERNGGKFGTAAVRWIAFTLKGDRSAANFFIQDGARADGWQVESANLNAIPVQA